jgi:hypothetical protein
MQSVLYEDGGIGPTRVNDFEMFLVSEGSETIYVSDLMLNITPYAPSARFSNDCTYQIPDASDPASTELVMAYPLESKVLSKDYGYELQSGYVITPNSVLPLRASMLDPGDPIVDEMISTATGATKIADFGGRALDLLYDRGRSPIAICISGSAFTPGSERERFHWSSDNVLGSIKVDVLNRQIGAPPVAPGGKKVRSRTFRSKTLRSDDFERGIRLFTVRRLKFL